jgi:hypothetical protein
VEGLANMSSIKLQYVLGNGLSSKAIAWFGGGKFSHVDIVLPGGFGYIEGSLLGARSDKIRGIAPGVQVRPAFYEKKWARRLVLEIPCTPEQFKVFHRYALDQRMKPYDKVAILGFLFGRNWRDDDSWFCDEMVLVCGEKASVIPELEIIPANQIPPGGSLLVYQAVGGKVVCDERN